MKKPILKILCLLTALSFTYSGTIVHAAEGVSVAPTTSEVTIANYVGKQDNIYITGVISGDVIKVYSAETGGKLLGKTTVTGSKTDARISLAQIGASAGSVYISVTSKGLSESSRTKINYNAEDVSETPLSSNIIVTNNSNKPDTIYVSGLANRDTVKVYSLKTGGKLIASGIVNGGNKTEITIPVSQLGVNGGSVYISVTTPGMHESDRTEAKFSGESVSPAISPQKVKITNKVGKSDTIYISGLAPNDVVKVYDETFTKLLATSTVSNTKTETTITLSQLGSYGGYIYITTTSKGLLESTKTKVYFPGEGQSDPIKLQNVQITNNINKPDKVYVTGLTAGDTVKIYSDEDGSKLIGSASVSSSRSDASINITQLGTSSGYIYISVTSSSMLESDKIKTYCPGEAKSSNSAVKVEVTNNAGKADTVHVSGISAGDIVKVYNSASSTTPIGSTTVPSNNTEATVSISQLGNTSGTIYVTVTSPNSLESDKITASYSAENKSSNIAAENVIVTNNAGKADTVYVYGITDGDVIKVYDSANGGNLLGSATVQNSKPEVTIPITQLGISAGSVYVSKVSTNEVESERVKVDYSAEGKSSVLDPKNVIVINNSRKADTVQVIGLSEGETIKVYDAQLGGNLLGSATVVQYGSEVTLSIPQLSSTAGNIYVSMTDTNKLEGQRVPVSYAAETQSNALSADNIKVSNNSSAVDTIKVANINVGDVVNVYDSAIGGKLLGSGTVPENSSEANISIAQLGISGGSIYVSVSSDGKSSSERIKVDFGAEVKTSILTSDNINITNNTTTSDSITITGLNTGDIIKVYDSAADGRLLGSAAVAENSTEVTIPITQLGTNSGSVYVTVTTPNKAESNRVKADYSAELKTNAPSAQNIIVTNNAGLSDTVQVSGLSANDVVKVYDAIKNGTLLGTATVPQYGVDATVSIPQLGSTGGNIYVSVASTAKAESSRTQVGYTGEVESTAPAPNKIFIVNNAGIAGTIKVTNVSSGDIIKVYSAAQAGDLLGTATVGSYDTEVTIPVTQLGLDAGSVYITVTNKGKLESSRTKADYSAKLVTSDPGTDSITVENNAGIQDTVKITYLQPNDEVKVYDSAIGGNLLGSAVVANGTMQSVITIPQLGANGGDIYVTVKSTGKTESSRTKVTFNAESKSTAITSGDITIQNNSGSSDIINVAGLAAGDVVRVYNAAQAGNLLGSVTVSNGDYNAVISIPQLGVNAGNVYISVTRSGKTESDRTKADYLAESAAPIVGNISITNNAIIEDTVSVKGLVANDIVKVYDAAQGGHLLGSAIVTANNTDAVVTISQLTADAGSVYVSVTNFGKSESNRTKADYISEQSSTALYIGNVRIVNNPSGTPDTITVKNLPSNAVIKVYDAASGGNLIGTATAGANDGQAIITVTQLGKGSGSVYATVTVPGKNESSRTKVDYVAEN